MKLALNLTLAFLSILTFYDKSFSITNNQINKICEKEKKVYTCKKNLQEKRKNLQKGNLIEIPVIPYKR
jgi:hypothetical protein